MQQKLDVGAVIRRVFSIYVDQSSVLMPVAAVVFVFTGVLSTVLTNASSGLRLLALLISLVATTLFTGMVVELVADVQDGRRDASPGQLLRAVTPVLGQLILVAILSGAVDAIADSASTALGIVVTVVLGVLTAPLSALAAAVLYFDLGGVRPGAQTPEPTPPQPDPFAGA